MKISEILKESKKAFASLEIVPPLKGVTKKELLDSIRPFMEFGPRFVNVTCHRDEVEYVKDADGKFSRHTVRRRVSQSTVCGAIQAEFQMEVVPHLICSGATADQIESQVEDFRFMGIDNVMALRGDSLLGEKRFTAEPGGYKYASELVAALKSSEKARELCVGVGGYPEKHFEAPNLEEDIANLKRKVDAGADFIITQMFFDNKVFFNFRRRCREAGINVPIIPGLKPLSSFRQVESLPTAFSLDIPQDLASALRRHCDDPDSCYRIGVEWCSSQCVDLLQNGVEAIHFYTMGRPDNIVELLKRHF